MKPRVQRHHLRIPYISYAIRALICTIIVLLFRIALAFIPKIEERERNHYLRETRFLEVILCAYSSDCAFSLLPLSPLHWSF